MAEPNTKEIDNISQRTMAGIVIATTKDGKISLDTHSKAETLPETDQLIISSPINTTQNGDKVLIRIKDGENEISVYNKGDIGQEGAIPMFKLFPTDKKSLKDTNSELKDLQFLVMRNVEQSVISNDTESLEALGFSKEETKQILAANKAGKLTLLGPKEYKGIGQHGESPAPPPIMSNLGQSEEERKAKEGIAAANQNQSEEEREYNAAFERFLAGENNPLGLRDIRAFDIMQKNQEILAQAAAKEQDRGALGDLPVPEFRQAPLAIREANIGGIA